EHPVAPVADIRREWILSVGPRERAVSHITGERGGRGRVVGLADVLRHVAVYSGNAFAIALALLFHLFGKRPAVLLRILDGSLQDEHSDGVEVARFDFAAKPQRLQ